MRCLMDRAEWAGIDAHQRISDATEARALASRLGHEELAERSRRLLARAETSLLRNAVLTMTPLLA